MPIFGRINWRRLLRTKYMKNTILVVSVATLTCSIYLFNTANDRTASMRSKPPEIGQEIKGPRKCSVSLKSMGSVECLRQAERTYRSRVEAKILLLVDTVFSVSAHELAEILTHNHMKFRMEVSGSSLPILTNLDQGKYAVIVFENLFRYFEMDSWNRELLDKYCLNYNVGIIGFLPPRDGMLYRTLPRLFPLAIEVREKLQDATVNAESPLLKITKGGETAWGDIPGRGWSIFVPNHSTYEPVAWAKRDVGNIYHEDINKLLPTVIEDQGMLDGVRRVFFGTGLFFWLNKLLFLDAISYLSYGAINTGLRRFIQIDIDDIFVGETGIRLKEKDVLELISAQERIQQHIKNFQFNLGFSGKFFHRGSVEENRGDDLLIQNAHKFQWFGHMWNHQQPHLYNNVINMMHDMKLNLNFAKRHNIPVGTGYSVAPHHSGVYPVHEMLFHAWKEVWNVCVTSTEEYPHLRPSRLRRGFVHQDIMVLPRQTCGLFTHTIFRDRYPGGIEILDESIQGGELFQTIVNSPVNVFMTHMSNYGNDRLALYTFESLIEFIHRWTNIELNAASPLQLGNLYFKCFSDERVPLWQISLKEQSSIKKTFGPIDGALKSNEKSPCGDERHMKIWSRKKSCLQFPSFLIVGPQKTGTTALHAFLSMHPLIKTNRPSPETFEELQFFNDKNYVKGIDWYAEFFPKIKNNSNQHLFEKSATYFDDENVPMRAHALLPAAKIIVILIPAPQRAYSWYQHCLAHGDPIASTHSFHEVVTASDTAPKELRDLRNRCLNPGKYAQHLERWLLYYPSFQIQIIDGEVLKENPLKVLNRVQIFLKIPSFNYSQHIKYDFKKGFYCPVVRGSHVKCLGSSKGRNYPPMDDQTLQYLEDYYASYNNQLVKVMHEMGYRKYPKWLKKDSTEKTK